MLGLKFSSFSVGISSPSSFRELKASLYKRCDHL